MKSRYHHYLRVLPWVVALVCLFSCNKIVMYSATDPSVQLAKDITIINDYLKLNNYTQFDTLSTGVRVVILENGEGEKIEYNKLVRYHYKGMLTNGKLFDTSLASLAYKTDTMNATVFYPETPEWDINGLAKYDSIKYDSAYQNIYNPNKKYEAFKTTHTPGGWFIKEGTTIPGFSHGTHYVLDSVRIGGSGLILIPSREAYGTNGSGIIPPNTVVIFEILPIKVD